MNIQLVINMASALIMFVGGMAIVLYVPGQMSSQIRVLIGVFVSFYFLVRVGQTILIIKRNRRESQEELRHLVTEDPKGDGEPKSS